MRRKPINGVTLSDGRPTRPGVGRGRYSWLDRGGWRSQVRRVERASRTVAPSLILSSQFGQTRGVSSSSGVKTRVYASVTNDPQFWHVGMDVRGFTLSHIMLAGQSRAALVTPDRCTGQPGSGGWGSGRCIRRSYRCASIRQEESFGVVGRALRRPATDRAGCRVYVVEPTTVRTLLFVIASFPGRGLVTGLFEEVVQ